MSRRACGFRVELDGERLLLDDLEAVTLEARDTTRTIGDQTDLLEAEVAQHLCAQTILPQDLARLHRALFDLPAEVQDLVMDGRLSMGHGRALIGAPGAVTLAQDIADKGLSVRETEALVRRLIAHAGAGKSKNGKGRSKDPDIQRLENDLADKLGATVELQHSTTGKGKLVISYHSLDELDGILAHIS